MIPFEIKKENNHQDDPRVHKKLFENEYERECLITILIKHIHAGNKIDEELKHVLKNEFDMVLTHLQQPGKDDVWLFTRHYVQVEDRIAAILYPRYEGDSYFLENTQDNDLIQTLGNKETNASLHICSACSNMSENFNDPDRLQEKYTVRQKEMQEYKTNKPSQIPVLDKALFFLKMCKKINQLPSYPDFKTTMLLNLCYETYGLLKRNYHVSLMKSIYHALKTQLRKLQQDTCYFQSKFYEIVNILLFNVCLDEKKNYTNVEKSDGNLEELFIASMEYDPAFLFKSFWTQDLRHAAVLSYAHHYSDFCTDSGELNTSPDDFAFYMMELARKRNVTTQQKCVTVRILLSDDIVKAYSPGYYYSIVCWLGDVGLLSESHASLASVAKSEWKKVTVPSIVILPSFFAPVEAQPCKGKVSSKKSEILSEKCTPMQKLVQQPDTKSLEKEEVRKQKKAQNRIENHERTQKQKEAQALEWEQAQKRNQAEEREKTVLENIRQQAEQEKKAADHLKKRR